MRLYQQAMKQYEESELISVLRGLIRCNSENPNKNEEEVATFVRRLLESEGIPAQFIYAAEGRPNVMATIKGSYPGKTIIWNGHLDVVPAGDGWSMPPYEGRQIENVIYGRGAADMKGGLASMLYAAILLNRMGNPFKGSIILYFNVDEERENLGMKTFINSDISADYALVGEPTDLDVCIGHKGVARIRVTTIGESSHAASIGPHNNAIYSMSRIVTALEKLGKEIVDRRHPIIGNASLIVTQIHGGTAPNIVPEECIVELDRRMIPGELGECIQREISDCIQPIAEQCGFTWKIDPYLFLSASFIDANHTLPLQLSSAIHQVRDKCGTIRAFEATCEASFFTINKQIPAIIFGPGSLNQAHVVDEFVFINEVKEASFILIDLIERLL